MRKHFIYIALLLLITTGLWAANPDTLPYGTKDYSIQHGFDAGNYEVISPGSTATGVTSALLTSNGAQAKEIFVTVETNPIRYTVDGTDPENDLGSNIGHKAVAGGSFTILGYTNISQFRCIDETDGSASSVRVTIFY